MFLVHDTPNRDIRLPNNLPSQESQSQTIRRRGQESRSESLARGEEVEKGGKEAWASVEWGTS